MNAESTGAAERWGSEPVLATPGDARRALTREELLGRVAVLYLRDQLARDGAADGEDRGTARFIIDGLTPAQTAAIARAILVDPELVSQFDVKLPAQFMTGIDLPPSVLTEERATYFRNAPCAKPALLLANTGDDEEQSLRELTPIGAPELQSRAELWVQVAAADVIIAGDGRGWWEQALRGLQALRFASLDRFADYVLGTRRLIGDEGLPIDQALDEALPALRLPKNAGQFRGLAPRARGQAAKWRAQFAIVHNKYAPFLSKQTPSGVVLSEDELRTAFDRVKDHIPEAEHEAVCDFIVAPGGWTPESARLAECDWESIKPLFDGLRRERFNLGRATLDFYQERNPGLLTDGERDYLVRLSGRRATEADLEDDQQFYEAHRDELREDRKLKSAWDRFVFGTPRETQDFLAGLSACLEGFSWEVPSVRRTLTIGCESRFRRDFRDLNVDAGLYFARRYAGLTALFGRDIVWDVGELFEFPKLVEWWQGRGQGPNRSEAKAALQLKFSVTLEFETVSGAVERAAAQFVWRYNPQWVASELVGDWDRLVAHPLVFCRANRESQSSKGAAQGVDLWNVRTLMASYGQDRGSLVGVYRRANDVTRAWREHLAEARSRGLLGEAPAKDLGDKFDAFAECYAAAIRGFVTEGLAAHEIEGQVVAYGALLEAICREAKGDRNRQLLLRPLLQVGTVSVEGGRSTAIVAPWHPLRLAAMARKARRVARLVRHLLAAEAAQFGDPRLFFRELRDELAHVHYPEVVLGWHGDQPELLALTDSAGDYSLHESPLAVDAGADDTNENPTEGASRVAELVRRYLALHPHEGANLSVVLYNCDSSRLPLAVVEKIGALHQDDEDARCQVVLRHRDPKQLSRLYEQIVDASDGDGDAYVASEATQDFMARLRIGISADQAPPPDPRDGCPEDIVFSQDVIARHARLEWYPADARPAEPETLNPAQWSRRRPIATGDMKTVVYLCCPVQRAEGWALLTAIASFFKGDWDGDRELRPLPARQLDFRDSTTARIFEETHNLAAWVVNYDELLDRRQLVEQGVRIIRYKQVATQGRNLIISSRAPMSLLRSMVVGRLSDLELGLDASEMHALAERFIGDANEVSGDIVLRAAQRGRSASELIGLVLSRYLVRHELEPGGYSGWYFLDDYAGWLGQREEQIADLLALSPMTMSDGAMRLVAVVTEAKYIDAASLGAKRKESHKQLRDTLRRIAGAVVGTPPRLDRDVWLARLSDLLIDGLVFPVGARIDLAEWRRAIREGRCAIDLRGYSHVFVSGPADTSEHSARVRLPEADGSTFDAQQEVFDRARVRELVLRYHRGESPTEDRHDDRSDDGDVGSGPEPLQLWQPANIGDAGATNGATTPGGDTASGVLETVPGAADPHRGADDELARSEVPAGGVGEGGDRYYPASPEPPIKDRADGRWSYPGVVRWIGTVPPRSSEDGAELVWLRQVEGATKAALNQFQLQAKLVRSVLTPNAALLKFQGSASLTVDQVLRRRSEFLTTHGLNLIGVQPEPGVVSLSIARPHRQTVSLRELWQLWTPDARQGNQDLLLGVREDDGELLILSPGREHAPHTLIAGTTGSGKSVLVQNIILSIAATNRPDQARITIIDPKQGVDYFAFEDLPHLDGGIIERETEAIARIGGLVEEMDRRYTLLRKARAANLRAYNECVDAAERLPTLWLIHDEFAEWMLVDEYKQEVSAAVQRLGVKARAAGIYLVFAAQRPDANVMPMQLRSNLGNRLILRVDAEGTSEIALGERGAERLLGRGHLLAKLEGSLSLVYAQVPFATPEELGTLVEIIQQDVAGPR